MVHRVYGTSRGERRNSLLGGKWYVTKIFQCYTKKVKTMKIEELLFLILSRTANITANSWWLSRRHHVPDIAVSR